MRSNVSKHWLLTLLTLILASNYVDRFALGLMLAWCQDPTQGRTAQRKPVSACSPRRRRWSAPPLTMASGPIPRIPVTLRRRSLHSTSIQPGYPTCSHGFHLTDSAMHGRSPRRSCSGKR